MSQPGQRGDDGGKQAAGLCGTPETRAKAGRQERKSVLRQSRLLKPFIPARSRAGAVCTGLRGHQGWGHQGGARS